MREIEVGNVLSTLLPAARADGGGFELLSITADGCVSIRFSGACIACPSKSLTLRLGIERALKAKLPWVTEVTSAN